MKSGKTLYLHIGCGKTGSSALQVWLSNYSTELRMAGVDYPTFGSGTLDAYAITSGNGAELTAAVKRGKTAQFLGELTKSEHEKLLLSSERFQAFDGDELEQIRTCAEGLEVSVSIVAYVRNVYDSVYAAYQQAVKRHLYHQTFREYALSRTSIEQFDVLAKYRRHFDLVHVLNYDVERQRGLEASICEILELDLAKVPPMSRAKVNRSLDLFETELMRVANRNYVEWLGDDRENVFSKQISDALIFNDPERETEILLDDDVLRHLEFLCLPAISELNRTYLNETPLSVFDPNGKKIVCEAPPVPTAVEIALGVIVNFLTAGGKGTRQLLAPRGKGAHDQDLFKTNRRSLINLMRDAAIQLETIDLKRAYALMKAAAALRPNGPLIAQKLAEYEKRLG